uniref:ATP synthase F0 subunit 8 n=1 Tax=Dryadomorpha sp. EMHAU-2015-Zz060407 TaxID=2037761 RepID=A0A343K1X8_9HEMI|nr:ATP synthase F0 subunit 8 [Dryadomorpha sp. EMHAU-2015-Zz060407]
MPQMAPMWWSFIMMFTIMMMMILMASTYFNFDNKIKLKFYQNKKEIKWMW